MPARRALNFFWGEIVEKRPLVLLVDDEEDLCLLMQMSLARMGIDTHSAHCLNEAKKFLSGHQYDACLTDLNLPDGNGLQLLEWINAHCAGLPVAVLTAYGNMEIAIAALKATGRGRSVELSALMRF